MDTYDYLFCNCTNDDLINNNKSIGVRHSIGNDTLNLFPKFNTDILKCVNVAFEEVSFIVIVMVIVSVILVLFR